jgi:hypothetical protein
MHVSKLAEDEEDQALAYSAELIFRKATCIREMLSFCNTKNINSTTKLRALVGFANSNTFALKLKTQGIPDSAQLEGGTVGLAEMVSAKVELPNGFTYNPNEVNQSLVDGVEIPIRLVLNDPPDGETKPTSAGIDWRSLQFDSNLGVAYSILQGLWDECLWNSLRPSRGGEHVAFSYVDEEPEKRKVVYRARMDNLVSQFLMTARRYVLEMPNEWKAKTLGIRPVIDVERVGRHQRLVLAKRGEVTERATTIVLLRALAEEPYYQDFVARPRELLDGATVSDVLSAWSIASTAADVIRAKAANHQTREDAPPDAWLLRHSPLLFEAALIEAVASGAQVERSRAARLVEFLTFRGEPGQELWAQPLVPVAKGRVAPVFGAALYSNLTRLIDIWIRQAGGDLAERGQAFEAHVRHELAESIAGSKLSKAAKVFPESLKFKPKKGIEEEIDVVFSVASLVFIGEVKCMLIPTDPKAEGLYRQALSKASEQVQRKVAAVENHKDEFRDVLRQKNFQIPDGFAAIPLVILNRPIGAGFQVSGVSVVDEHILRVFFDGSLIELALAPTTTPEPEAVKRRIIYEDLAGALGAARTYFGSPPQMEVYVKHIKQRKVPIPRVSEADWSGEISSFDCLLETPAT